MGKEVEQLADFVASTRTADVPAGVREHAKLVLLDTLGVVLAGSERPEVRTLRARLEPQAGAGASVWARGWPAQDARSAALLNGIAGRAIELCEGLRLVSGQAAVQVLPSVLALAEARATSGDDLLGAFILGYEAAGRFCSAFTARALAHQNGQACLLGAAAGGARIAGLDAAQTGLCMRAAATLMLTPSYTNAVAGATALNVAGGMSGFAGALAPELAAAGFAAKDDAIEEALGRMVGEGFDPQRLLEGLGRDWQIARNYFRLHACCNPIHPALDALQAALAELEPAPQQIARIDVATYRFASVMRDPRPQSFFASKYSLPHAAAVLAVRGALDHAALDDSALHDPLVASLRSRVHVVEDPAMSAAVPKLKPARVTVTLTDGRETTRAVTSHRGDFDDPYPAEQIRAKFRQLAGAVLDADGVAALESMCGRIDEVPDVRRAVGSLRQYSLQPA